MHTFNTTETAKKQKVRRHLGCPVVVKYLYPLEHIEINLATNAKNMSKYSTLGEKNDEGKIMSKMNAGDTQENKDIYEFNDIFEDSQPTKAWVPHANEIEAMDNVLTQVNLEEKNPNDPKNIDFDWSQETSKLRLVKKAKPGSLGTENDIEWQVQTSEGMHIVQESSDLSVNTSIDSQNSKHSLLTSRNGKGGLLEIDEGCQDSEEGNEFNQENISANEFMPPDVKNLRESQYQMLQSTAAEFVESSRITSLEINPSEELPYNNAKRKSDKVTPLKSNKHAHQCPKCYLWKLKSTFDQHAEQCETASNAAQDTPLRQVNSVSSTRNLFKNDKFLKRGQSISKSNKIQKVSKIKSNFNNSTKNNKKKDGSWQLNEQNISTSNMNIVGKTTPVSNKRIDTGAKSFRWDFEKDVIEMFQSVRNSTTGYDVTLACWDGQSKKITISKAHKELLSAASPVLRTILYVNALGQKNNSYIYLNGIDHRDICYILEFVYGGEVCIPESGLYNFLSAAKLLKIKGITCNAERRNTI